MRESDRFDTRAAAIHLRLAGARHSGCQAPKSLSPTKDSRHMICPHCKASMYRSTNPYFGVGLSVHEYLANCPECEYFEYIPNPRTPVPEPNVQPSKRSAFRRLMGGMR